MEGQRGLKKQRMDNESITGNWISKAEENREIKKTRKL